MRTDPAINTTIEGVGKMQRMKIALVLVAALGLAGATALRALAQDHPQENPNEHPSAKGPSTKTLEKVIKDQVAAKAKSNGGKFPVEDPVLNKTWQLELVRVHTDKLAQLDDKTYFACVDFKADDGTPVDVDFYMKNGNGKLTLSDTALHKVNGKPRFNYEKKGGYWERVPAS